MDDEPRIQIFELAKISQKTRQENIKMFLNESFFVKQNVQQMKMNGVS